MDCASSPAMACVRSSLPPAAERLLQTGDSQIRRGGSGAADLTLSRTPPGRLGLRAASVCSCGAVGGGSFLRPEGQRSLLAQVGVGGASAWAPSPELPGG